MAEALLEARNLMWKIQNKTIIDVDTFRVFPGDHAALIGPNGSGKSSLIKILAFLQQPTSGQVNFRADDNKRSIIEKRRSMAVIFQEPLLLNMTVYDNVAYGLKIRNMRQNLQQRVEYWLEKLNISHLRKRFPKNLSGGEAQRVSIARAMALEPEILFLDEPFTALDAPTKAQMLEDLSLLIKQSTMTSIFITHDFAEIPFLADKVFVMSQGRIVQEGSVEEVFYRPATEEVADLVGADNQYEAILMDSCGEFCTIQLPKLHKIICKKDNNQVCYTPGKKYKAYIRSDDVALGMEEMNTFRGRVQRISPHGLQYKLQIDCGFNISIVISKQQFLHVKPSIGGELTINIPPDMVHLIEV
ncbi:MAG: ABC transporter ATP-binding protein [Bacillota bacterium]